MTLKQTRCQIGVSLSLCVFLAIFGSLNPAPAKPVDKAGDKPADKAANKAADRPASKPAGKSDGPKVDREKVTETTAKPKIVGNFQVPADMQAEMDRVIGHEEKMLGGSEYLPNREIGRGKLSSCQADCYVVLYILEGVPNHGSNCNTQFMATFTYVAGKPIFLAGAQIGGRGLRYSNIKSIGPDSIKLSTEFYLPKDPMSTPSGRGHANFVVADRHIIETP